jgi:hypothetical protein
MDRVQSARLLRRKRLKTEVVMGIFTWFMAQRFREKLAHPFSSRCGLDTIDFKETCLC